MKKYKPTKKHINRTNYNKSKQNMIDEANRLKESGAIEEGIEILKNEAALSDDEHLIFALAKFYMAALNYESALEELKKIENVSTINHFFIYSLMAQCYFERKEYSKSYEYNVKAYEADERKSDKSLKYILISARNAKIGKSCLKYVDSHPKIKDKKTQFEVIFIYRDLDMFQEALDYINQNELVPDNYRQYILFAEVYYEAEDLEKANFYIKKICDLNDSFYILLKAKIQFKNENYNESIELLNMLIEKKELVGIAHIWLIENYLKLGRLSEIQNILNGGYLYEDVKKIFQANLDIYNKNYGHARELIYDVIKRQPTVLNMLFLVSLDLREEKYEETLMDAERTLDLFGASLSRPQRSSLFRMIAVAKVNLGIPVTGNGYYFNQVINYSKERAIEHIRKHYESIGSEGIFFSDMNLEETFEIIEKRISVIDPSYLGVRSSGDSYLIDFENAGIVGSTILNKMQVVTIINTKKIITFYPVSKLSFNYEIEEEVRKEKVPVKRLSQIEKFNQRYNKK